MRFRALTLVLGASLALVVALPFGAPGLPAPGATPGASPAPCPLGTPPPVLTSTPGVPFKAYGGAVTIRLTDRGFDPAAFELAIGAGDYEATLINTGTRRHTFTMPALGVDVSVAAGETATATIPSAGLGTYPFFSTAPCDEAIGMRGVMVIYL